MPRNRIFTIAGVLIAAAVLIGGSFFWGFQVGKKFPQTLVVKGVANMTPEVSSTVDFSTFWQAWQIINDSYLRSGGVNGQEKVYGAISGLVGSLGDPYSTFFSPSDNKKFQEDIQGNFGGVGMEIGFQKDHLVVIAPLKDTPSSRAGLKAGDQILAINSSSTDGMTVEHAVQLIRGPINSEVVLTIFRDGWDKPKDFKIVRQNIVVPTLDFEMKGNVAYVALHSFNANANLLFYQAMLKALTHHAQGLVLDVRDDPGGYLEVAVDLAGWFLPRGTLVVREVGRVVPTQDFRANGNTALVNFPTVILINKGSASASEILAGALRDQRHIPLIGEQSFGKGTVQQLENLKDGSSIKLTVAHWVLPSGQVLENGGLKPDVEVKTTDDDVQKKRDPQLEKALEMIQALIGQPTSQP